MLLSRSLAFNTLRAYGTGIRQYHQFCNSHNIPPLPLTEFIVENFAVSLCTRVGYKTIIVYLYGVQYWSKIQGCRVLIKFMPRLRYVLSAIRRVQGNTFKRPSRPPVTWHMLERICAFITKSESPVDADMLTSAVLLALFGLLRVSEYTTPSTSAFDEAIHLTVSDVAVHWDRRVAIVYIKMSKTDPFRDGVHIRVGMLDHYLCPVRALVRYLSRRGPRHGPLFMFRNGAYLTRARILDIMTRALPNHPNVNTHSFRRGGASALASAGTPDHIIQLMGRWKSNAFKEYIQLNDDFVVEAHKSMVGYKP